MSNKDRYINIPLARLAFPALYTARATNDDKPDEKKFQATFLISKKDKKTIKNIEEKIDECAKKKWGKVPPKLIRTALQDGEVKDDYDGYDDTIMFVPSASKHRPQVVDRDKTPTVESDGIVYGGCQVMGVISLYAWEFKNRKGVSANLDVVRFMKDDEPFGAGKADLDDVLPDLDDEDDDDMFGDDDE